MSGGDGNPIDFYFDFLSPYGYFAACLIDGIAARHGRTVRWHPILLGVTVVKVMGLRPVMETPLKRDYFMRDIPRMAKRLGIEFRLPETGQPNPLNAARATVWLNQSDPALAKALALRLMRLQWTEGRDISGLDVVAQEAAALGVNAHALSAAVQSADVKALLAREVDAAVARGVFGSPFIIADGEPFWGSDRLDMLDEWLCGKDGGNHVRERS